MLFLDLVDIGNGIIESFLGKLAGLCWVILDFVVEDRVVEGQTESDGVGGLEVGFGNAGGLLVGFVSTFASSIMGGSGGVLGNVSVVISLHFVVEDLGFGVGSLADQFGVDELNDLIAIFVKFGNNLGLVSPEESNVLGSLLLLFLLN